MAAPVPWKSAILCVPCRSVLGRSMSLSKNRSRLKLSIWLASLDCLIPSTAELSWWRGTISHTRRAIGALAVAQFRYCRISRCGNEIDDKRPNREEDRRDTDAQNRSERYSHAATTVRLAMDCRRWNIPRRGQGRAIAIASGPMRRCRSADPINCLPSI